MTFSTDIHKANIALLDRTINVLEKLDKLGLHKLVNSMGEADGAQRVKDNATGLMSAVRQDLFKTLVGVSPKRLLLIGGASVIGLYATIKVINAALNYETQRLAIKNGISEALAQTAPKFRLPPPGYGPLQQPWG